MIPTVTLNSQDLIGKLISQSPFFGLFEKKKLSTTLSYNLSAVLSEKCVWEINSPIKFLTRKFASVRPFLYFAHFHIFGLFCTSTHRLYFDLTLLRPKPYFDFFGQTLLRPKLSFDLFTSTKTVLLDQ